MTEYTTFSIVSQFTIWLLPTFILLVAHFPTYLGLVKCCRVIVFGPQSEVKLLACVKYIHISASFASQIQVWINSELSVMNRNVENLWRKRTKKQPGKLRTFILNALEKSSGFFSMTPRHVFVKFVYNIDIRVAGIFTAVELKMLCTLLGEQIGKNC